MPIEITESPLPGALLIKTKLIHDDRGYFAEAWSEPVWTSYGLDFDFRQDSLSNSRKGVLRGMHYQLVPHEMGKLIRVVRGSIFDVGVDLRKGSPTFGKWVGYTLSAENGLLFWLPSGFAHGFLALEDDTTVYYKSTFHHTPESERSLAWNDPAVAIEWPSAPEVVSPKDQSAPGLDQAEYNFVFKK
jgi:dTDP-4-dehydrorhamnose 3,5-epimerase